MSLPLLGILLVLSFVLEPTIVGVPLVFAFSILFFRKILIMNIVLEKETNAVHRGITRSIFAGIMILFFSGFIIDALRINQAGTTSMLLLLSAILIVIYTRGFEMQQSRFFSIVFFAFTFIYAFIMGYDLKNSIVMLLVFLGFRIVLYLMQPKYEKNWTRVR